MKFCIDFLQSKFVIFITLILDKIKNVCSIVKKKWVLKLINASFIIELLKCNEKLLTSLAEGFNKLYVFVIISKQLINYYTKQYFVFFNKHLNKWFISIVIDNNDNFVNFKVFAFFLIGTLSKSIGRIFILRWLYLLKASTKRNVIELLFKGMFVKYQNKGNVALHSANLVKEYIKVSIKCATSSNKLEGNFKALEALKDFKDKQHLVQISLIREILI
ncbi:MAG: hypothetical protein N3A01_01495 [Bacteroidales bacterium]|nr:hypothetical protein [Bacteroidales bacterium]